MRTVLAGLCLFAICIPALGCGATETPMSPVTEDSALITLEGEAQNAKLGAIVLSDGQGPVYCRGLEHWPDAIVGRRVRVTGRLNVTDQFKAQVSKDGAISQGTAGGDAFLLGCTYEALP